MLFKTIDLRECVLCMCTFDSFVFKISIILPCMFIIFKCITRNVVLPMFFVAIPFILCEFAWSKECFYFTGKTNKGPI